MDRKEKAEFEVELDGRAVVLHIVEDTLAGDLLDPPYSSGIDLGPAPDYPIDRMCPLRAAAYARACLDIIDHVLEGKEDNQ